MNKWLNEPIQGGVVDDSGNPIDNDGPTIQPGTPDHLKHGGKHHLKEGHKEAGGQITQGTSTSQVSSTPQTTGDEGGNNSLTQCEKEFDDVFQAIRNGIANVVSPLEVNTSVSLPSLTFESSGDDDFLKDMLESKDIKIMATMPIAGNADAVAVFIIKEELHILMKSQAAKHFTTRVAKSIAKPFCEFIDFKMWFESLSPQEQWNLMGEL